jgi:hypothetical protein
MEFCFDGGNAVLGCKGINVQRMFWDQETQRLVGLTRSGKYGPGVSAIDIATSNQV